MFFAETTHTKKINRKEILNFTPTGEPTKIRDLKAVRQLRLINHPELRRKG